MQISHKYANFAYTSSKLIPSSFKNFEKLCKFMHISQKLCRIPTSLSVFSDPENMSVAVGISLLSCT